MIKALSVLRQQFNRLGCDHLVTEIAVCVREGTPDLRCQITLDGYTTGWMSLMDTQIKLCTLPGDTLPELVLAAIYAIENAANKEDTCG